MPVNFTGTPLPTGDRAAASTRPQTTSASARKSNGAFQGSTHGGGKRSGTPGSTSSPSNGPSHNNIPGGTKRLPQFRPRNPQTVADTSPPIASWVVAKAAIRAVLNSKGNAKTIAEMPGGSLEAEDDEESDDEERTGDVKEDDVDVDRKKKMSSRGKYSVGSISKSTKSTNRLSSSVLSRRKRSDSTNADEMDQRNKEKTAKSNRIAILPITIPYGFQLTRTLPHARPTLKSAMFVPHPTRSNLDTFVSLDTHNVHIWQGINRIKKIPTVGPASGKVDLSVGLQGTGVSGVFGISKWIYVKKYKVYLVATTHLMLKVLDADMEELSIVASGKPVLSLEFAEDSDELIAGGVGNIRVWKFIKQMKSTRNRTTYVLTGPRLVIDDLDDGWVAYTMLDCALNRLYAACDSSILVFHFKTGEQLDALKEIHDLSITCCVVYEPFEYLITAGKDAAVKIWNSNNYLVHEFRDHLNIVTALMLLPPASPSTPPPPVVLSCSTDGTIRMYNLDTLQCIYRLDTQQECLGMDMVQNDSFYHFSRKNIFLWSLNRYQSVFSYLRSRVTHICRVSHPPVARIVCVTEDGSIRLINPTTGLVLVTAFPVFKDVTVKEVFYDIESERIITLNSNGDIVIYTSDVNPCKVLEVWEPAGSRERCNHLAVLDLFEGSDRTSRLDREQSFFLIGGADSGQLINFDWKNHGRQEILIQAHTAEITALTTDSSTLRIFSGGRDHNIKIWKASVANTTGSLSSVDTSKGAMEGSSSNVNGMAALAGGNSLELALIMVIPVWNFGVPKILLHIPNEDELSVALEGAGIVKYGIGNEQVKLQPTDEGHMGEVSTVVCLKALSITASASTDGTVKIWDSENSLIREIQFSEPILSVCFANERGDLLVGLSDQLSVVKLQDYLPIKQLYQVYEMDFSDDPIEQPTMFDSNVDFWEYYHHAEDGDTQISLGKTTSPEAVPSFSDTFEEDLQEHDDHARQIRRKRRLFLETERNTFTHARPFVPKIPHVELLCPPSATQSAVDDDATSNTTDENRGEEDETRKAHRRNTLWSLREMRRREQEEEFDPLIIAPDFAVLERTPTHSMAKLAFHERRQQTENSVDDQTEVTGADQIPSLTSQQHDAKQGADATSAAVDLGTKNGQPGVRNDPKGSSVDQSDTVTGGTSGGGAKMIRNRGLDASNRVSVGESQVRKELQAPPHPPMSFALAPTAIEKEKLMAAEQDAKKKTLTIRQKLQMLGINLPNSTASKAEPVVPAVHKRARIVRSGEAAKEEGTKEEPVPEPPKIKFKSRRPKPEPVVSPSKVDEVAEDVQAKPESNRALDPQQLPVDLRAYLDDSMEDDFEEKENLKLSTSTSKEVAQPGVEMVAAPTVKDSPAKPVPEVTTKPSRKGKDEKHVDAVKSQPKDGKKEKDVKKPPKPPAIPSNVPATSPKPKTPAKARLPAHQAFPDAGKMADKKKELNLDMHKERDDEKEKERERERENKEKEEKEKEEKEKEKEKIREANQREKEHITEKEKEKDKEREREREKEKRKQLFREPTVREQPLPPIKKIPKSRTAVSTGTEKVVVEIATQPLPPSTSKMEEEKGEVIMKKVEGEIITGIEPPGLLEQANAEVSWNLLRKSNTPNPEIAMDGIPDELVSVVNVFWFPGLKGKPVTLQNIVEVLLELLHTGLWSEKCQASKSLLFLYHTFEMDFTTWKQRIIRPQLELLYDEAWQVRAQIASNLLGYGVSDEILFGLICRLADPHPQVRASAMQTLSRFGINTRETLQHSMRKLGMIPPAEQVKKTTGRLDELIAIEKRRILSTRLLRSQWVEKWISGVQTKAYVPFRRRPSFFDTLTLREEQERAGEGGVGNNPNARWEYNEESEEGRTKRKEIAVNNVYLEAPECHGVSSLSPLERMVSRSRTYPFAARTRMGTPLKMGV